MKEFTSMASEDWQQKTLRHLFTSIGDDDKQFNLIQSLFGVIEANKRSEWLIKILDALPASDRIHIVKWCVNLSAQMCAVACVSGVYVGYGMSVRRRECLSLHARWFAR